jgi:hypothetical protein
MTIQTFGERVTERPDGMYVPIEFPEFARVDTETRDGRTILSEGFGLDQAPRTLYFQKAQAPGHDGAVAVGRIDSMSVDDKIVTASGWIVDNPDGRAAAHLVKTGVLRGNSVDLAVREKDVLIDVEWSEDDDFPTITAKFRNAMVTASTLVGKPAFENAAAIIPDGWDIEPVELSDRETDKVLAAAGSRHTLEFSTGTDEVRVDGRRFQDPELDGPTPVYIEASGAVWGHIAAWGSRHLSTGVEPPHSNTNYAYFATGAVHADDGWVVPTGRLVLDGNHADKKLGWRDAVDHYANTTAAWADVAIGEDDHGIWIAGQVRPGTDDRTIHVARNSALSGDWRSVGGHMELIAALSVNTPGFPIPRPSAYAVGHTQRSLLSAGVISPSSTRQWMPPAEFLADVALLASEARGRRAATLRYELELDR